ncbi:MAG: hypothetical protein CL779_02890 [Chloroflexi bacterium]|nr:hypothetical protein [Chloroflexota bacterium]|tara:strand:+ start:6942 stop:7937 length:996 start_codon:yes stop_codon:yes gene_type:complete
MKITLISIAVFTLSMIFIFPAEKISKAQNNFIAISGQITHIDEKKIPKELVINLITIHESGEQSKQSTIALNGYYMFFTNYQEKDLYFTETIYQNIKYISDYYDYSAKINESITIDVAIFEKSNKLPLIENIVTKFTLSKIDYSKKEITFIREDIIRNTQNWTYFFDDQFTPTYKMHLLNDTINAVGNLGNDRFLQNDNFLNIAMPILPGMNTISTIHTTALSNSNAYSFIFTSIYDTNIIEVIIPTRFSKEIIPIKDFQKKGEQFFEKERMLVFQAENISKGTKAELLINKIFIEKNFFLAQNNIFAIISIIIISSSLTFLIIKARGKNE